MKILDIAQVARASGVPASTIRFYEEKGLVSSIGRRGARRLFEPAIVERLALIALGKAAGFSLDEILSMFGPTGGTSIDRDQLRAKANELEARIGRLKAMRDGLRHAADCQAPSHSECPTFQRLVRLAGSGRLETAAGARERLPLQAKLRPSSR